MQMHMDVLKFEYSPRLPSPVPVSIATELRRGVDTILRPPDPGVYLDSQDFGLIRFTAHLFQWLDWRNARMPSCEVGLGEPCRCRCAEAFRGPCPRSFDR